MWAGNRCCCFCTSRAFGRFVSDKFRIMVCQCVYLVKSHCNSSNSQVLLLEMIRSFHACTVCLHFSIASSHVLPSSNEWSENAPKSIVIFIENQYGNVISNPGKATPVPLSLSPFFKKNTETKKPLSFVFFSLHGIFLFGTLRQTNCWFFT